MMPADYGEALALRLRFGAVESYRDINGRLWVGVAPESDGMEVLASLGGRVWVAGGLENGPDGASYVSSIAEVV